MSVWRKLARSNFIIKLKSWEYWPFGIVQFPLFFYFAWLALKSRSLIFFSASNPGIPMGGMFGESKYDILKSIPERYTAKSIRVNKNLSADAVINILKQNDFSFPVIFKPDLGERGFMVKKIASKNDVENYLRQIKIDFIAQEFIDLPMEFGIFYSRNPKEEKGNVTSVVMKEMLTVTGDGKSALRSLILATDRAKLQWEKLQIAHGKDLDFILQEGEKTELVSIGNHCLGTTFLNYGHLINTTLSNTFDNIAKQIPGFYFGRFDLRCASLEDLYAGEIKIMELNGCGAEPAHIYHPGYSLFKAIGELFVHWRTIFQIAQENNKRGIRYTTFKEAQQYYRSFKNATS
jgi:hypothetical protein